MTSPKGTSRITAGARVQRLLAVLQWAASQADGVPISSLCERFGLEHAELVKELEMAAMIGADSIHYDEMPFEVIVEDAKVWVRLFSFGRPLRLTPAEGLALVAAADALVGRDASPDSPLWRALTKLANLLGIEPGQAIDVELDPEGGPSGRLLNEAIASRQRVRFTYWTYGRDEVNVREVDPWRVFSADGAWYLTGRSRAVNEPRRFRLDRIESLELLEERAGPLPARIDTSVRVPDRLPQVVLDLPAEARWVAEAYPVVTAEPGPDGRILVTLAVAGSSWLERLLLRIGPEAVVVQIDPQIGPLSLLADAAARVLNRYEGRAEPTSS